MKNSKLGDPMLHLHLTVDEARALRDAIRIALPHLRPTTGHEPRRLFPEDIERCAEIETTLVHQIPQALRRAQRRASRRTATWSESVKGWDLSIDNVYSRTVYSESERDAFLAGIA